MILEDIMAYIDGGHLRGMLECSHWDTVLDVLNEARAQKVQDLYHLGGIDNHLELQLDFMRNLFRPQITIAGRESRYYYNPEAPLKMVDFLDCYEGAIILTSDFDLILSMAKEYFVTGDVKSLVTRDKLPEIPFDEEEDDE